MQETRVWSLGREDPLEKEMATHSSIIAWRIPWMEEPGRLQSTGSQRVRHDWATSLSLSLVKAITRLVEIQGLGNRLHPLMRAAPKVTWQRVWIQEDLWLSPQQYKNNNHDYWTETLQPVLYIQEVVRTSIVVQWLRICLPMQGTWVQSLLWEDSTCSEAIKPMSN